MSLVENERVKLTASYLNTGAGACFAAGVVAPVAPVAAVTFGYAGTPTSVTPLTFVFGVTTVRLASLGLHIAARVLPKGLEP